MQTQQLFSAHPILFRYLQAWAVLEQRAGNFGRARKLFDAALVADRRLSSAWHGWAVLELKDGNISKARDLIRKGIKLGEPSAYLYQVGKWV